MLATTATEVAIFPGTARNPRRKGSSAATAVAKLATWPATATMPTSRSAIPAEASVTSRNFAIKSNVTGVARSAMLLCSAAKPVRLTATSVATPATWRRSVPSKPPHNQCPLLPLLFFSDLMVGCIIFSESSSLAKGWLTEASPGPVSLSTCNMKKGGKYLYAFNTKKCLFSLVAVLQYV